jgi:hypothetical protein
MRNPTKKQEEAQAKLWDEIMAERNNTKMKNKTTKLPFEVTIMDTEPQRVENRFGGDSIMLDPEAVAVYDVIMGAEMMGLYGEMQKGLDWFRENHPKAYMILLD